jgi:hypothetical protein
MGGYGYIERGGDVSERDVAPPTHEEVLGATSLAIERFLVAVLNSREPVRLAGDLTTLDSYRLAWP